VEQYPENHTAVKPFMFFFADGDKALGLKQIETSISKGIFTRTEASFWLAIFILSMNSTFESPSIYPTADR
jgi:hypothetical protein